MTRLTLFIYADGKAIVSVPDDITNETVFHIREAWTRFAKEDLDVLIIKGDVRYVDLILTDDLRIERAKP